jgi:hypothetical protein
MAQKDMLFHEVQEFKRHWFAVLVLPGAATLVILFGSAMYSQLGRGVAFGPDPMPDLLLWILGPLMIALGFFLMLLFLFMRLVVTVKKEGLYIRYEPFVSRRILYSDIADCESKAYSPLREYGGWGIRGSRRRRAYNVRGNRGVMLHFKDGSTLLIGSQRADELADAIKSLL